MLGYQEDRTPTGCAIGMAYVGAGIPKGVHICERWNWLTEPIIYPCECFGTFELSRALTIIAHLFDHHFFERQDWTLEQLVDWVRSVEPPEPDQEQATGVLGRAPLETNQESRSVDEKVSQ